MDPEENGKQPGTQDPPASGGESGGAKGSPALKAENARLIEENKAANKRIEDLQGQLDALNESLSKALTEEDVEAAVKEAQEAAEEAHKASESAWEEERKRLSVKNALIAAGCTDTIGCMAFWSSGELTGTQTTCLGCFVGVALVLCTYVLSFRPGFVCALLCAIRWVFALSQAGRRFGQVSLRV